MSLATIVNRLEKTIPGWGAWGRWTWCREQRKQLGAARSTVIWVHDSGKVPWALWGARNGFFVVEWAGPLAYLRAVVARA